MTLDYLPRELLERVLNVEDFPRVLVLDKWTCNSNGRQAIFWKAPRNQQYTATFIDHRVLLQCRRVDVSRLSPARRIRQQLRLRGCDGMEGV
jgi:hypothetical protein